MPRNVPNPDLLAWWRFDERNGTTAKDSSGYGHHGRLRNMSGREWGRGKVGGAIYISGANHEVEVPDRYHLLSLTDSYTMAAWMKLDDFAFWGRLLAKGKTGYQLMIPDRQSKLQLGDKSTPANSLQKGVWQHIALVNDGDALTFYVGGKPVKTAAAMPHSKDTLPLIIGNVPGMNRPLKGWMDELRLYQRALSSQ